MANFDIHIGSQPITYNSKVTFKNVENCDALNNNIQLTLVSPVIEEHSLLQTYTSPTNVKEVVITNIVQADTNQYLQYNGVKLTTTLLPITIPVDDFGLIDDLRLIEKFVPLNNVTSLRIDFYIIDENDTVGPAVTSYIQAKKVACTETPVIRDPYISYVDKTPDFLECQTADFTIQRNGSTNPVKYKITTLAWGSSGYTGNLQDADTALSYIGQVAYTGSSYIGQFQTTDVDDELNFIYRVCAAPAYYSHNECGVLFQIFKEDGVTINEESNIYMQVKKLYTGSVDPVGGFE